MNRLTRDLVEAPLEREHELADLGRLLDEARSGHGGILVLEGPAGIGKTRLLQVARALAQERAVEVLGAVGAELEGEFSFGVALQLFEGRLAEASEEEREELLEGAAALATPLFRGLGGGSAPGDGQAFPLFHGLYWLTSNLAEGAPLLLAVDDAHWADRPSLEFLLYLSQRLEDLPVALVLALRPGEPEAADDLLARLCGHRLAETVRPGPLSLHAGRALVRARLPDAEEEFTRTCWETTKGNPFLLGELLTALEVEGVEPTGAEAERVGQLVPDSVTRSVLGRLARLPDGAQALARAVAVLGHKASLRHAATLSDLGVDDAREAADVLVATDTLVSAESLAFVHPLIRSSIYVEVPPSDRARLHRRAAQLLADEGAPPEQLATHLLQIPAAGDGWVLEALRAAARRALGEGAPGPATRFLRRALEEPPPKEERPAVLLELGRAEALAGEPKAAEHLANAVVLLEQPRSRAAALLDLGRTLYGQGRLRDAAEAFDRGRSELGGEDRELEAELQAAWISIARLDPSMRAEAVERIAPFLEHPGEGTSHGERVLLAHAAEELVFAGERREEAIALARRALGDGALLEEETSDGTAWGSAVNALAWSDDFEGAERGVEAALEDARRRGSVIGFALASEARFFLTYYTGRLAEAVADAQQAIDATRYGWAQFLPVACAELAWAQIERGELDAAAAALDRVEWDPHWSKSSVHAYVLEARARLHLLQGRAQQALNELLKIEPIFKEMQVPNASAIIPWGLRTALAAAQTGDRERGRALAEQVIGVARRFGAPRALGMALRAAGLVEGGVPGIELLREAVSVLENSPAALEHARALIDLGAALRREGKRTAAREPLRRGLDRAHRFGAVLLERQAREELLASGARPRRTALRGVEALTPSEGRVAKLASEGLSNREVAQALFVTLKTVEAHLSNAYDKLGIASRRELPKVF